MTGSAFIPSIAEGLALAKAKGLFLPILWNSSGYDSIEALEVIDPHLDVYLPDLKTVDASLSRSLFGLPDYPETSTSALKWLAARHPLSFRGEALRTGLIVRHLVFPGLLDSTEGALAWFAENLKGRALLSLMFQYTPVPRLRPRSGELPGSWDRRVSVDEYEAVLSFLERFEIEEGFVQELPEEESLLPDFTKEDAFPANLASCVWFHGRGK